MISIVIPLYNKEQLISNTLRTVLDQTYKDFEIIIVNDGSTDGSVAEVEKFNDSRIRLIHQENAGVSVARNRGIQDAYGTYIALLDADDEWKPDYLATQIELINKYPEATVFATNYEFHDEKKNVTPTVIHNLPFESTDGILSNYFEIASTSHPPIWTSAVIVKKEAFQSIGGFPIGIKSGEDLLTWARLAIRYRIAYSIKPMAIFNIEGYELSERPKRMPAEDDVVGYELINIKKNFNPPHIGDYISHWYKMRSSVYMRLGMRRHSIKEAFRGLRFNPANYKLLAYIAINLLPRKLQPF